MASPSNSAAGQLSWQEGRGAGFALLGLALAAGGALRLHLALTDDGIYWPDEIYQSFEPAHRLVFGYGMVAWEFLDGARNWALPGLVAGLLRLAQLLGLTQPAQYIGLVKCTFGLFGVATAWSVYLLARAYQAERLWAAAGALAFALAAPAVYFAPRAMSETASALPLVLGLALSLRSEPRRWQLYLGASLLGLSVLLRLQSGVFCAGLLAVLLFRGRWRWALQAGVVLSLWAVLFGALDHWSWGALPGARFSGWFHSALKYVEFNLLEGKASAWGTSPPSYYLRHLFASMPLLSIALLALSLLAGRRAAGLLAMALAFFALHSAVPHKELRFLVPVLPLFCALLGVGLSALPRGRGRFHGALGTLAAVLWSAATHGQLTFGELGQYGGRAKESAYDDFGPVNRMLLAAHQQPDLCGLRVDATHLAWSGGHTYLHRDVPLYHLGQPPLEAGTFNYVITSQRSGFPGEVVASDARRPEVALVRVREGGCRPDVGYSWRLP